jgi:hypothetical protein
MTDHQNYLLDSRKRFLKRNFSKDGEPVEKISFHGAPTGKRCYGARRLVEPPWGDASRSSPQHLSVQSLEAVSRKERF